MINSNTHKVDAFTIFEVTVVLAIMSVIISIIAVATNRFNEQLKFSQDISTEMNQFRLVRSTLWKDFTTADSITFDEDQIHIFKSDREIKYQSLNEKLHRNHTGEWQDLNVDVESIYVEEETGLKTFHIEFLWKDQIMDWHFMNKPSLAIQINSYFDKV